MNRKPIWTKPYYGVTHLETPKTHQITMQIWDDKQASVFLLHLKGLHPFTAIKEHFGPIDECRAHAEKWLEGLR